MNEATAKRYSADDEAKPDEIRARAYLVMMGLLSMIPPWANTAVAIETRKRQAPRVVFQVGKHWVWTELTNLEETPEMLVNQALDMLREHCAKEGEPLLF